MTPSTPRTATSQPWPALAWLPLVGLTGLAGGLLWWGGPATFALPALVLGLMPLGDLLLPGRPPGAQTGAVGRASWRHDLVLYALAVEVPLVLLLFLRLNHLGCYGPLELLGAALSMGIVLSAVGLNVAHILGHRARRRDRILAVGLLCLLQYGHWRTEHNRGHHVRVSTPEDHATPRRGESYYAFLLRGGPHGLLSAWRLERARMERRGRSAFSLHNEVLRAWLVQALLLTAIGTLAGAGALGAYLLAALIAIGLTESINYIQHYGLMLPDDLRPLHAGISWNSDATLTRMLMLELSRHSDHHRHPMRAYPLQRPVPEHPVAPTGHPGLILLALVPPLWFWVMDARLDALDLDALRSLP